MKKLTVVLTLIALFAFASNAFAQGKMSAGIDVGYNLPMGDFKKDTKGNAAGGIGFGGHFGYMVNDNIQVGLGVGYASFGENKNYAGKVSQVMIPVMLNGRYYFSKDKIMPYAALGLGMTSYKVDIDVADASLMVLTYRLGVGACYTMSDKMDLDFGISYNTVASDKKKFDFGSTVGKFEANWNATTLGINLGVNFKF